MEEDSVSCNVNTTQKVGSDSFFLSVDAEEHGNINTLSSTYTEQPIDPNNPKARTVNFVATEAGETSRPGREISSEQTLTIQIKDPVASELKKRFEKLREAGGCHPRLNTPNGGQKAITKIRKVPVSLQDHQHFDKYFKPRIVALGPIHHDTEKYQPAEEYKLRMTNRFVTESDRDLKALYNVVESNIKQLRQCFHEEVAKEYGDLDLAWMLFVDGCAILQSIHYAVNRPSEGWKMKYALMAIGTHDLFLLENQVPFQLLVYLMNFSAKKDILWESITKFMDSQILHGMSMEKLKNYTETETPNHLLDILRTLLISKSESSTPGKKKGRDDKIKEEHDGAAARQRKDIDRSSSEIMSPKKNNKILPSYTYRNVEELRSAGIHVKTGKTDDPLTTITFTKLFHFYPGYLGLSPIIVDDSMGPKFLNLIAYEMCSDFDNKLEITSYILFLDSLIDNIKDVRKLRNAGILRNHLGSDEEVARLFNEIGTDLVPDPDAYREVKDAIQEHYNTRWKTWIAEVRHEHCRSPWTFLAVLAAIMILVLTFIQTWLAF